MRYAVLAGCVGGGLFTLGRFLLVPKTPRGLMLVLGSRVVVMLAATAAVWQKVA